MAHEGGKVVSPTHQPPLCPRKYTCYSFLLEASRPQGHSVAGRIMSMKNSDTIRNRTCDLPACTAVTQPAAPPRDSGAAGIKTGNHTVAARSNIECYSGAGENKAECHGGALGRKTECHGGALGRKTECHGGALGHKTECHNGLLELTLDITLCN